MAQTKFKHEDPESVKAKELWVHFQRLYNPNPSDRYWRFEADNKSTLWKYYSISDIHHVSTQDGVDVFMLTEKEYPLKTGVLEAMVESKLRCEEITPELKDLVSRIMQQSIREAGRRKSVWKHPPGVI